MTQEKKYDIFISYSRKDFNEVNAFVEMLKQHIPALDIWFDLDGIESGDEFRDKIISAIKQSKYVLFALSKNSDQSEWTRKELQFAKGKMIKIVPLLLKGIQLQELDWFLFEFGGLDCIDITDAKQLEKMVKNLAKWTNKELIQNEKEPLLNDNQELKRMEHNHEYVDLGLSVKWANCNVGASKPEEYGDYFAWGETQPKIIYNRRTYKWYRGSEKIAKYNNEWSCGIVDNKTTLEWSDDAARANWGGSWRMPTEAEWIELKNNCTWTWTTQNGVCGYKVMSKRNGNSIFLSAAGYFGDCSHRNAGSNGYYWSSSLNTAIPYSGCDLNFNSDFIFVCLYYDHRRYCGLSVRPVCP